MKRMKDIPAMDRPYEKCFAHGPQGLTDCELLSVILRTGTQGLSAYELAGQILTDVSGQQDLLKIMHLSREQLMSMKGVGKVKTIQILCIGELAKRISSLNAQSALKMNEPSSIAAFYMERMRHLEQENLIVMYLDTKCHLIRDLILTRGTVNRSLISAREIFVEAMKCNAVTMVLVHNHPSGDCTPSRADIIQTKEIKKAGELVGVTLLDHIIIGDRKYSSLNELGLLS